MDEFIKLGAASDFADGSIRTVDCNGKKLAVANAGGKIQVIENTCCHKGGPLGEGTLAGNIVACPWHGWRFDVSTGACLNNPAAKIATYESKIENGQILVKV